MNLLYRMIRAFLIPLAKLLFPYKVIHAERIPRDGSVVLCSNHISLVDPVHLAIAIPHRQIHFMAKEELFHSRLFGGILRGVGAFPVKRGRGDVDAMKAAYEVLNQQKIMGIFPEGTRSKTGELGRGKAGAAILAYRAGADILPVAIVCHGKPRIFKRVKIVFGEIVPVDSMNIKEGTLNEYRKAIGHIMDPIRSMIEQYRAEDAR